MASSHHIIRLLLVQRGGVAIWFALCLPILLGFGALAVDLARLNLTKVELQNAADAAALGGARSLSDASSVATDMPYNWTAARQMASQMATSNFANGNKIRNVTIDDGFWNIITRSFVQIIYPYSGNPIPGDVPAIRVTITISSTQNSGPFKFFFAPIFGIAQSNVQASAIAVIAPPGAGTGMFPVVINMAMFTNWWDTTTRSPKLDPDTGKPWVFDIGDSHFGVESSYWTTFQTEDHSTPDITNLFTTGNTTNLAIGDLTWLPSGVKAAVYNSVPENKDVAVYVVDSIESGSWKPIVAIAGLHVIGTVGNGANTKIKVQFLENVPAGGTNPGNGNGLPLGAYTPPILVE